MAKTKSKGKDKQKENLVQSRFALPCHVPPLPQVVSPCKTKHKTKGGHQNRTTWLVMAWHDGHQRRRHGQKTLYGHWLSPRVRPSTEPKTSTTRHDLACVGLTHWSSFSLLLQFQNWSVPFENFIIAFQIIVVTVIAVILVLPSAKASPEV